MLNLHLGDVILIPWFKIFVQSLLIVIKFLRNNQEARRILGQLLGCDIFTLYLPTITRWYSLKSSAGRLLKIEKEVKTLAQQMFFANKGEQALVLLTDDEFWEDLKIFDAVMHALSKFTLVLESDSATLADFVFLYVMMCAQVLNMGADDELREVQSGLFDVTMDRWCRIFLSSAKSTSMRYIVFLATFFVHPRYARIAASVEHLVVIVYEWLDEYCGRLGIGGSNRALDIWDEIKAYSDFVTKNNVSRQPVHPFWISNSRQFPILGEVAPRLLSIPASASLAERCWSLFARHLTSTRPRLSIAKLNDTGKILSMAKFLTNAVTGLSVASSQASFFDVLKALIPTCVMDAIGGSIAVVDDEPKEAVDLSEEPPGQGLVEKEQAASDQDPVDELEELNTNMASSDFDHNEDESVDPLRRPILGKENLRDMFGKLLLDLAKNVSSDTMTAFL